MPHHLGPDADGPPTARGTGALSWVAMAAADARHALRHWRRSPLATLTMLVVLSLGIGTTVVLFTILDSIATRPAPGLVRDASLVRIRGTSRASEVANLQARLLSWPEVEAYAARRELFSSVAAHAQESAMAHLDGGAGGATPVGVIYVSPTYFATLGLRPLLGTTPPPEPDVTQLRTAPTAMISEAMWRQRFGGSPDVLGRVVRLNDQPVEIVGVAPTRFLGTEGGSPLSVWVPLAAYPLLQQRSAAVFQSPDSLFLNAAARLAPNGTQAVATAAVSELAGRFAGAREADRGAAPVLGADVVPMLAGNARIGDQSEERISTVVAAGLALLVLLVTATNVSALLVGLAVARRQEIGVRLALGAPRRRLIRQLLTESVLLALLAAGIGLLATTAGLQLFGSAFAEAQLVVDWRVAVATAAVALATGMLFGISPALHATRVPLHDALRHSAAAVTGGRSRLQRGLVVTQVALTQPLLVGVGVLVATALGDLGGRARPEVAEAIAEVELDTWAGRTTLAEQAARIDAVVTRVRGLPGVIAAMPMQAGTVEAPLMVHPGDRLDGISPATIMAGRLEAAPTGYFEAFGIPIVMGRDFERAETMSPSHEFGPPDHRVVIIGSDLARRLWGAADPIGRRLALAIGGQAAATGMTVVGVVEAAAAGPSEVNGRVRVFVPYASVHSGVVVHTDGPALPLLSALRAAVVAAAPQLPVVRAETLAQREAEERRRLMRTSAAVAGGGLLALLLSAMGLYAVVAFSVAQRTREIGIRTAIGAPRGHLVRTFVAQGLALTVLGLVVGLPLSLLVLRVIGRALQWPLASSPLVGIGIAGVVLAVAAAAVWIPSRRASRVDPIVALRAE